MADDIITKRTRLRSLPRCRARSSARARRDDRTRTTPRFAPVSLAPPAFPSWCRSSQAIAEVHLASAMLLLAPLPLAAGGALPRRAALVRSRRAAAACAASAQPPRRSAPEQPPAASPLRAAAAAVAAALVLHTSAASCAPRPHATQLRNAADAARTTAAPTPWGLSRRRASSSKVRRLVSGSCSAPRPPAARRHPPLAAQLTVAQLTALLRCAACFGRPQTRWTWCPSTTLAWRA